MVCSNIFGISARRSYIENTVFLFSEDSESSTTSQKVSFDTPRKLEFTPPGSPRTPQAANDETGTPRRAKRATTMLDSDLLRQELQKEHSLTLEDDSNSTDSGKRNLIGYNVWDAGSRSIGVTALILTDIMWSRVNSSSSSSTFSKAKQSFQPFLEMIALSRDDKSTWQLLETLSIIANQANLRDTLLEEGLVEALLARLDAMTMEGVSEASLADLEDAKLKIQKQRTSAKLRAVLFGIINNSIAGLSELRFPLALTSPKTIELIMTFLKHEWDEKEKLRTTKSAKDNAGVFPELQALLALVGNMTFCCEAVASFLVKDPDNNVHFKLLKDMLESSTCCAGAAAILCNARSFYSLPESPRSDFLTFWFLL